MPTTYDDDQKEKLDELHHLTGIGPDEEKSMENRAYSGAADDIADREMKHSKHDSSDHPKDSVSEEEQSALKDAVGETGGFYNSGGADDAESDAGGGFYKGSGKGQTRFNKGVGGQSKGLFKKRGVQLGLAGGALGLVATLGMFSSFLNIFRMDHFMKNVDRRAYTRLAASIDTRNRYLMSTYIKARATEIPGDGDHNNVFFKANKVDTQHPMNDWYRTLRKNRFEEDVLNKKGVYFTSLADDKGNLSWRTMKGNDSVDPALVQKYNLTDINSSNMNEILNKIEPDDLDKIFTSDVHGSHKEARKAVKTLVNDDIPWFRVIKRRHIRKDIQNITGIKNWRLFEKTRDKIADAKEKKKLSIYNKIIDKYFSKNPNTNAMLKCLFSDGKCPATDDSESPDGHGTPEGDAPDDIKNEDVDKESTTDADGKTTTSDKTLGTKATAGEITDAVEDAASAELDDVVEEGLDATGSKRLARASFSKKLVISLIAKMSGKSATEIIHSAIPVPDPTKIWTWARRLTVIHNLIGGGSKSKVAVMVKNAKRAQLIGLFATYTMANDQMKSGQLVSDELNEFFKTTANIGNSEGWGVVSGQISPDEAKKNSPQKTEACKEEYEPKETDFGYFCDSQRPDYGGRAEEISKAYDNSVGIFIKPVATVVNGILSSVIGKVIDKGTELIGKPIEAALGPAMEAFMGSDWGKSFTAFFATAVQKLMDFLGAGPIWGEGSNNLGSLLAAGGVGQAESSSRAAGGFSSTPTSRAYSDKLAAAYVAEQRKNQSMYERYIDLDSPDSVASTALFAATNTSASTFMTRVGSIFSSFPRLFGSAMTGKLFAQNDPSADLSSWAGADRYDIPQQCIEFDPVSPLEGGPNKYNGTNYYNVTGKTDLDYATVRDNDKFYKKVYEWAETDEGKLAAAKKIWNCWVLDARAMGGLGFVYGYNQDAGYNPAGTNGGASTSPGGSITASSANLYMVGDSYTVGMKTAGIEAKMKEKGWNPTVTGLTSRHLQGTPPSPDGVGQLDQDKNQVAAAGVVVVALGTNDIGDSKQGFTTKLQAVYDKVKALAPNAQIVWVNYYLTKVGDKGKDKVDALNEFANGKNIKVVDYAGIAGSIPYDGEGIHPTTYAPIVDLIVKTLGDAPKDSGSGGAATPAPGAPAS